MSELSPISKLSYCLSYRCTHTETYMPGHDRLIFGNRSHNSLQIYKGLQVSTRKAKKQKASCCFSV